MADLTVKELQEAIASAEERIQEVMDSLLGLAKWKELSVSMEQLTYRESTGRGRVDNVVSVTVSVRGSL